MKNQLLSFMLHISSFALLFALSNTAIAQTWIVDGQQTQVLQLEVSDPQAVHTDGSRPMEASLEFSSSLVATSGLFRAYYDLEGKDVEFFIIDGDRGSVRLSSISNVGLELGPLNIKEDVIMFEDGEDNSIHFEEHCLYGPWRVDAVDDENESIINRSYADARYLRADIPLTAPIDFAESYSQTGAVFKAYAYDEETTIGYFYPRTDENGLILCGTGSSLLIGSQNEGLSIYSSLLFHTGYGSRINFEAREFSGGAWTVAENPTTSDGIVPKGYADARYLRADSPSMQPLTLAQSLTATNGALQIYATDDEAHLGYFKSLSFQDGLQFSTSRSAALFFGESSNDGLLIGPTYIMQTGYGPKLNLEAGRLEGVPWTVSEAPVNDQGIISRGYADVRYLMRSEGITTNRVIQAGDTLVISNGLITAINP